ncbi:MAG TPA: hypothetical protein VNT75_26315 [Symbiobacteriaceae bacterium]|nr:hypothetical protein [Symbiobacteriaceae bacterium]
MSSGARQGIAYLRIRLFADRVKGEEVITLSPIDMNQEIFQTQVGRVVNWETLLGQIQVTGGAEIRRGINLEVSYEHLQDMSVLLDKWMNLELFVKGSAKVTVQAQAQVPLDFFAEAGLAVRLQAIAKAGVAVGLRFSMTIGQLVDRMIPLAEAGGVLPQLIGIFLDDVRLYAELHGQVAVSAMAFANLVVTGSLLSHGDRKAGFTAVFDYGMGFEFGGGFRAFMGADFVNPRRMVTRATDLLVRELFRRSERTEATRSLAAALRAGIRLSYEVGQRLSENASSGDAAATAVSIIVQEGQRALLDHVAQLARTRLDDALGDPVRGSAAGKLVLQLLEGWEDEPTAQRLTQLLEAAAGVTGALPESERPGWERAAALFWAAAALSMQLAALVLGEPGPLTIDPATAPAPVVAAINAQLGREPQQALTLPDLFGFMLAQAGGGAGVPGFLTPALGATPQAAAQALLTYTGGGDQHETLRTLAEGLAGYVSRELSEQVAAHAERAFPGTPEVADLIQSSLVAAVQVAAEVVLPQIANQFQGGLDRKALTEALSVTLLSLVGRTAVRIFDSIATAVTAEIRQRMEEMAESLITADVLKQLGIAERYDEPVRESIRIISKYMGKLPAQDEMVRLALLVAAPLQPGRVREFMENLKDPTWIPNAREIAAQAAVVSEALFRSFCEVTMVMLPKLMELYHKQLLQDLNDLIARFETVLAAVHEHVAKNLTDQVLEPVAKAIIDRVLPGVRMPGHRVIPADVIRGHVQTAVSAAIRQALKRLVEQLISTHTKLNAPPILDVLRRQDVSAFASTIGNQLLGPMNQRLGFNLTVPVRFSWNPVGEFTPSINFRADIPVGFVGVPRPELAAALGGLVAHMFGGVRFAAEYVWPKQDEIAQFIARVPEILRDFESFIRTRAPQGTRIIPMTVPFLRGGGPRPLAAESGPEFAAAPGAMAPLSAGPEHHGAALASDPLILFRPRRTVTPSLEAAFHYPGFRSDSLWAGNIIVVVNNRPLPLQAFRYLDQSDGGIAGRPPGLVLLALFSFPLLRRGANTVQTIALDPYGNRLEATRTFMV